MATFPSIAPEAPRDRLIGAYGVALHQPIEGAETAIRLAGRRGIEPLVLNFPGITTAQLQSIWQHYLGQRGPMVPFDLPALILEDILGVADYVPAGYGWIYDPAAPIDVDDLLEFSTVSAGRHDVTVRLMMVPEAVPV